VEWSRALAAWDAAILTLDAEGTVSASQLPGQVDFVAREPHAIAIVNTPRRSFRAPLASAYGCSPSTARWSPRRRRLTEAFAAGSPRRSGTCSPTPSLLLTSCCRRIPHRTSPPIVDRLPPLWHVRRGPPTAR
jgi:hypothetical protein